MSSPYLSAGLILSGVVVGVLVLVGLSILFASIAEWLDAPRWLEFIAFMTPGAGFLYVVLLLSPLT